MRLRSLALAATLSLALPALAHAQQPADHHDTPGMDEHHDKPPVPSSKQLVVSFQGRSITMSVEDLLNLPQTSVHVHNAHSGQDEDYRGPLVSEVLARVGLHADDKETEPLILHGALVATATDNYYVLYSLAELEPGFATGKTIVAVMRNGLPDPTGIQLVNNTDAKPARWIHGVTNLNVVSMARTQ